MARLVLLEIGGTCFVRAMARRKVLYETGEGSSFFKALAEVLEEPTCDNARMFQIRILKIFERGSLSRRHVGSVYWVPEEEIFPLRLVSRKHSPLPYPISGECPGF